MNAAEIVSRLGGARRDGKGWRALCPAHEDRSPSLSLVDKDGKVLWICRSGCSQEAVLDALTTRMLWGGTAKTKPDPEFARGRLQQRLREHMLRHFRDRNLDGPPEAESFIA